MAISKSRILIIGATGFIGRHFTKASLAEGHPTYLLVRDSAASSSPEKAKLLESFRASGANILQGSLDDYASLVEALKKVDVVISAVGDFQRMSQINLIKAIKEVGNIKRFLPSEFAFEFDRFNDAVGPVKTVVDDSVKIRRAVEAEHIPYTYVICNCFAEYFVPCLGQVDLMVGITPPLPHPPTDKISIYGDGKSKAAFVKEEDIATYTIKTVDDPRTLNKFLYFMPPANTMSANELVGVWEKMIGKTLEKDYVSEEELLKKIADAQPELMKHYLSVCHYVFMKGDLTNFEIGPHGAEATQLYPNVTYSTVEEILSRYV